MFCPSKKIGEWAEQRRWVTQGGSEANLSGEQGGGEQQEEQDGHLQQQQDGLAMERKRRLEDDWRRGRGVGCCLLSRCIFPRPWRLHGSESTKGSSATARKKLLISPLIKAYKSLLFVTAFSIT